MSLNDGIENEKQIETHLDSLRYLELNRNLRAFIYDVFNPSSTQLNTCTVHAKRTEDNKFKPDLIVSYINKKHYISIKKGSGNSVHQEPINVFIEYIKNNLNASPEVINSILFFHWGDGTLDGSAPVYCRMKASEIIEKYPEKITIIQNFFNAHENELLERFLLSGVYGKNKVDYFYYGDYKQGDWRSTKEVLNLLRFSSGNALSVGGLSFQNYGRSLNGQDDSRRNSIQLKWPNMTSFFLVGSKSAPDIESKVIGDNSHGFQNVTDIINNLNNKPFFDIPNTLKEFINNIFEDDCSDEVIIQAKKINRGKGDMLVWLSNNPKNKKNISIISGSGTSVHQEKVDSFCEFLKNNAGLCDNAINEYLLFHFADGTNNNTGRISDRQTNSDYKKTHLKSLQYIEQQFSKSKSLILEHFIKDNSSYDIQDTDYIMYGNTELPYWAKVETLIELECQKSPNPRAALAIGDFSIQAWNRSLEGKADWKRLDMQVKWNNLLTNIQIAQRWEKEEKERLHIAKSTDREERNKAIEGLTYELKFTSYLNRDKAHHIWQELGIADDKAFFVNVSYNQTSKLAGSKIRPKSDCFVAKVNDPKIKSLLVTRNYILTEEYLNTSKIDYEIIPKTGISVKMPTSKDYTIQKLSFSAFKNIFPSLSPAFFIAALLYVDQDQLKKNELILSTFNISLESLCKSMETHICSDRLLLFHSLKTKAINTIKNIVNSDLRIRNIICFGDEIFDPPYVADYIYEGRTLLARNSYDKEITVTTGSGRSSGKYTLAFK